MPPAGNGAPVTGPAAGEGELRSGAAVDLAVALGHDFGEHGAGLLNAIDEIGDETVVGLARAKRHTRRRTDWSAGVTEWKGLARTRRIL